MQLAGLAPGSQGEALKAHGSVRTSTAVPSPAAALTPPSLAGCLTPGKLGGSEALVCRDSSQGYSPSEASPFCEALLHSNLPDEHDYSPRSSYDLVVEILSEASAGSKSPEEGFWQPARAASTTTGPSPQRPGDLRRRKYIVPQAPYVQLGSQRQPPHRLCAYAPSARLPSPEADFGLAGGGVRPGWDTVLIEGPLQQHVMLGFWRWRWCVVVRVFNQWELRVYRDEAASLSSPARPLQRHPASVLVVIPDAGQPSTLSCMDAPSGEQLLLLRTGGDCQLGEPAAWRLWAAALQAAGSTVDFELP